MTGGRRLSPHEALRREWGEAYHFAGNGVRPII
jgi:hypothetical protein